MLKWILVSALAGISLCKCEVNSAFLQDSELNTSPSVGQEAEYTQGDRNTTSPPSNRKHWQSATYENLVDALIFSDVVNCSDITTCAHDASKASTDVLEFDKAMREAGKNS
jgi:hypothetical protein